MTIYAWVCLVLVMIKIISSFVGDGSNVGALKLFDLTIAENKKNVINKGKLEIWEV
jgi:hypothetical protein